MLWHHVSQGQVVKFSLIPSVRVDDNRQWDGVKYLLNKTKSTALKAFSLGFTVSISFGNLTAV